MEKRLISNKAINKYAQKMAFSKFSDAKKIKSECSNEHSWKCCDEHFCDIKSIHLHISMHHKAEVIKARDEIVEHGHADAKYRPLKKKPCTKTVVKETSLPKELSAEETYCWLPKPEDGLFAAANANEAGQILLFYQYREIEDTTHVCTWQRELCCRLKLTGKVRVSREGLNATVGGTVTGTEMYIEAVCHHPLFIDMTRDDFKISSGSDKDFPDGLKVGIYSEAVPMGVAPDEVSYKNGGKHLTPAEFHQAVQDHLEGTNKDDAVIIDCRNFYESKIGHFTDAVCPDIRKFSYWPEYVDRNKELFQDKKVYMYCTGGIRCERGSAYLKSKGICKDIYQLKGGIHKYIEEYPDGFFRGKMFVFDDRYHLKANSDVLSACTYCKKSWDSYQPCSSSHCHQLVLCCDECRSQGLTACCHTCHTQAQKGGPKEECDCTRSRDRVPVENIMARAQKDKDSDNLSNTGSVNSSTVIT